MTMPDRPADVPLADDARRNVGVPTVDASVQTSEPAESAGAEPVTHTVHTQVPLADSIDGMETRAATRSTTRRKAVDGTAHSNRNAEGGKVPRTESPTLGIVAMKRANTNVLAQDEHSVWQNGVRRLSVPSCSTTKLLSWVGGEKKKRTRERAQ